MLLLVVWFHNSGRIVKYIGHKEESQKLAKPWLEKERYPTCKTEQVLACIVATHLLQQPQNLLQQIIWDADLYHLSLGEYYHLQLQLREEIKRIFNKEYTVQRSMKENLIFIHQHEYFTSYAKTVLEERKQKSSDKERKLRFRQRS